MASFSPEEFLIGTNWKGSVRQPLSGDASSRSYERITKGKQTAILMVDPSVETVRRFLTVTNILSRMGYSVPKILAENPEQGLLLLEDFGDRLFADLLIVGADEEKLYTLAVDFLIDLRKQPLPIELPFFSPSYILDQNSMFLDWYVPAHTNYPLKSNARTFYQQIWTELLKLMSGAPEVMLYRDFHAENVLYLEDRPGIKALGLLDYQDAMTGPAAYDLVSLLQDARRDVSEDVQENMIQYYCQHAGVDETRFRRSYAIMGAHRALRILGIFTRLLQRDGKNRYQAFVPRVKAHLMRNLAHPDLIALSHWLDVTLGKKF